MFPSELIVKHYRSILNVLFWVIPVLFSYKFGEGIGYESGTPVVVFRLSEAFVGWLLATMFCTLIFGGFWLMLDIHRLLQE